MRTEIFKQRRLWIEFHTCSPLARNIEWEAEMAILPASSNASQMSGIDSTTADKSFAVFLTRALDSDSGELKGIVSCINSTSED